MPRRRADGRATRQQRDADPDLFTSSREASAEPSSFLEEVGELFPGASPRSAVSVGTLTQTTKDVLEGAFVPLWVRGEVSDFKAHRNGHWYFCLRDASAQIRCVVWSRDRRGIPAAPDDGMQVVALGQLTVYAARGEMQLTVRRMEAEGDGLRRKALELTRARLEADGLLAPERKRPLPRYPSTLAVVTSPDGAALHDVLAVVRRRAPHVRVIVVPAAVQGETAPEELCYALDQVSRWGGADTVIVGRGGGAREDLRAFNDERVARALARCGAPTISAVGHEIDVTICDLVADHRAPTPSAAAEAAVRAADELRAELRGRADRALSAMMGHVEDSRTRMQHGAGDLSHAARAAVERRRSVLQSSASRLHVLSPVATLARGYGIARSEDGRTLASADQFQPGTRFELLLRDGRVRSTAERVLVDSHTDGEDAERPRPEGGM